MKKAFFALCLATLLFACHKPGREAYVCNCKQQAAVAAWLTANIGPANNLSDEEMEDVIFQLERTGVRLHCQHRILRHDAGEGNTLDLNFRKMNNLQDSTCDVAFFY